MKPTVIEPALAAGSHDAVLALALGSLSLIQRVEDRLGAPAPPDTPVADPDPRLVFAALGVIALGRSLRRWIEEAAEPTDDATAAAHAPEPAAPPASPRGLLR